MTPVISQPYRLSDAERRRAARSLGRGLRPLVLNAVVLVASLGLILWADLAVMDTLVARLEQWLGQIPAPVAGGAAAVTFVVPWLIVYAIWRVIWFRIVRRRVAALTPGAGDLVATLDDTGIRVDEQGLSSNWLAWAAVTSLRLAGDTIVVASGTFGLMIPLAAIGGRNVLTVLATRISPAAMAASDRSIRDAVA